MFTPRGQTVLAVVLLAAVLAVAGSYARRRPGGRCELDGMAIDPAYRVRAVDDDGAEHCFCCIRCARLWLEARRSAPRAVYVTDETGGGEVDAAQAWYVRSTVVTTAASGNRVHAFRDRGDAERHAAFAGGRLLGGADRPFTQP